MRRLWLIFAQTTTVLLAVVFVFDALPRSWLPQQWLAVPGPMALAPAARPSAEMSYSAAALRAMPAVVSVTSTRREASTLGNGMPNVSLGSGVIVSADGYVLTNNHVVSGANRVVVRLADHRAATARIIGRDPDTDLALLHVDLKHLPTLRFANDRNARVGDVVLAIGYPFGVGQTVTQGIISALGRNELGIDTYENFIQTDASINPGNSGGALVDTQGELLGINTAIFSRTGASLGIGFAIPVSTVRFVLRQLIAHGAVQRGWIGVAPRNLSSAQAAALKLDDGVRVDAVLRGGPAAAAGMHAGDVVLAINGQRLHDTGALLNTVAQLAPGSRASVRVLRGGRRLELRLRVGLRPPSADDDQP